MSMSSQSIRSVQSICSLCNEKLLAIKTRKYGSGSFCKNCYADVILDPSKYAKHIYDCGWNSCSLCSRSC